MPNLSVTDRRGLTVNPAFSIPGSSKIDVFSYSRGADGTMALCGNAFAYDGSHARYIGWISGDGTTQSAIRMGPYLPNLITAAPDGTLWTLGYELIDGSERKPGVDVNAGAIRHFDKTGKQLGAYVPRSSIGSKVDLAYGELVASVDRVGWYSYEHGQERAYIEVTKPGTVTRFPQPKADPNSYWQLSGIALTASNRVFVSIQVDDGRVKLYTLDREKQEWVLVPSPPAFAGTKGVRLLGAEGDELAFLLPDLHDGPQPQTVAFFKAIGY